MPCRTETSPEPKPERREQQCSTWLGSPVDSKKAAWTFDLDARQVPLMDHLDEAKSHVVNAMIALEDALTEALPAQDPSSETSRVRSGIAQMKRRMRQATEHLSDVEAALTQLKDDGG